MKKTAFAVIAAASVTLLSGCSVRIADMTVSSTKNYNINSTKFLKGKRVTGDDTYPVILFPLGFPNMKTAIDHAIEKDQCAVGLTDVVLTQLNHSFLVGTVGIQAEGNLIIDTTLPGCGNHA